MKSLLPAAILLALPLALCAETPQPVFFFDFNSPGKVEANKGSDPSNLVFRSSDRQEADLHGPAGSGLTGAPTDLALDNSSATAMGKDGLGGLALVKSAQLSAHSFTFTGWIKAEGDRPVGDGARVVEMVSPAGGFFVLGDTSEARWRPSSTATPSRQKRTPMRRPGPGFSSLSRMMAIPTRSFTTSAPRLRR